MQAGYAHEVIHTGPGKDLPVLRRNGSLIANHKRDDHARVRCIGQGLLYSPARELARPFDPVLRPVHHRREPPMRPGLTNVTGGAKPALEQPGLVIKSVGIGRAVRPPQSHDELPALAGVHPCRPVLRRPGTPPRENDAARRRCARRDHTFDIEVETHPSLVSLR